MPLTNIKNFLKYATLSIVPHYTSIMTKPFVIIIPFAFLKIGHFQDGCLATSIIIMNNNSNESWCQIFNNCK